MIKQGRSLFDQIENQELIQKLIDSGLMSIEPNKAYKKAVNTLKRYIKR